MAPRRASRRSVRDESSSGGFFTTLSDKLNKEIGENTVVGMDSDQFVMSTVKEYIDTQCYGLNYAMHLDGVPIGRIVTIRGDFMSGKSTLATHMMIETQKMGGFVCYLDTEFAFAKDRAENMGLDLSDEKFMLLQLDTVEKTISAIRKIFAMVADEQDNGNDQLVTIVWDSVGATATKAEMEAEFGESRPGVHARLISAALRQLTPQIAKYRVCFIILNQEKAKMDFFSMGKADAVTMTAEKPIMFHSTIVLRPQRIGKIMNSKTKEATGIKVRVTVSKNKLAAPFGKCDFIIDFATGINNTASILSIANQLGIVKKSGAWYQYDGNKFHEKDFGKILEKYPEIMEQLEVKRKKDQKITKPGDDEDDVAPIVDDDDEDDEDEPEEDDD